MEAVRGQEEERGKIPSFQTIKLTDLDEALKKAHIDKTFLYIADLSGKAHTFFKY